MSLDYNMDRGGAYVRRPCIEYPFGLTRDDLREASEDIRDMAERIVSPDDFLRYARQRMEPFGWDVDRQVMGWHERHVIIRREHVSALMQRHRERKWPTVREVKQRPVFRFAKKPEAQ